MEELLPTLLSFPPHPPPSQPLPDTTYDSLIRGLLATLNGTPAHTLTMAVNDGGGLLDVRPLTQ